MKILLLISETGKGNSLIVNEILKIRDIKLEVITISKRKSLFSKIKGFFIKILVFIYTPNFKFKYLFSSLLNTKSKLVSTRDLAEINNKIDEFCPDLLVISGTKKIDQKILKKVKYKINLHHGLVPSYRGVSSSDWVSYESDFGSFGVTVHEPTDNIDEGPVLACERILPFKGEPLFLFKHRVLWEGYFILINCIRQFFTNKIEWTKQDNFVSRNLKQADKPRNFFKKNNQVISNFDKFSSLNGRTNPYFYFRYKFNKPNLNKKLCSGWYILNYHDICSDAQALQYKRYKYPRIYTTLSNFQSHIQYMQNEGEILSIGDALKYWETNNIKDKTIFSITFDDGLFSSIDAMRLLKDLNIAPTLFLNGKPFLDTKTILNNHLHLKDKNIKDNIRKNYLSSNDLIKLYNEQNYLFELGSHTYNHKNLLGLNADEVQYEINHCHNFLEKSLKCKIPYFAFPFGKLNTRNYHADKATRLLGIKIFECYGGINRNYKQHFNILRIGVHNETKNNFHSLLTKQWVR